MSVYAASEIMPSLSEVKKILCAKLSYEKALANSKSEADFNTWCDDRTHFFTCVPRGIAYSVSQKSYEGSVSRFKQRGWGVPKPYDCLALKYFIIAVALDWKELIAELKTTLRYWKFSSADLQEYAKQVWQEPANLQALADLIESAQKGPITLIEAVEKHSTLNPKLFTKEELLKDRVRDKMLEIVDAFLEDLKEQDIKIKVDDILLIGSNASYNYTKDSDIDLHILANAKAVKYEPEIGNALYSAYRSIFNKQLDITIFDIPLEVFVETENSKRVSNGIYSVKKNKWLKKPVHEDIPEYDKEALNELFLKWETKCKDLFDLIKADKLDDEKRVIKLLEDIYDKLRKKGISKGEYSIENLAFKELRNNGYLDKLKDYRNELMSKRLSLEERLNTERRADIHSQIKTACGTTPIIQDNGMFFVYNLKAPEINRAVQALRGLSFVEEVTTRENGKYDFSQMAMTKLPTKYYDIRGSIKN